MALELIKLNAARQALIVAKDLNEIKEIMDTATAFQAYAKAAKMGIEMQNDCAEIKIRAERKAGEFLAQMEKAKGAQGVGSNQYEVRLHDVTAPKLSDLGIKKIQSHRWQKIASVPENEFEKHVSRKKEKKEELTSSSVLQLANNLNRNLEIMPLPNGKFDVIYADPPWKYFGGTTINRQIENQYPTMDIRKIADVKVPSADNSVLFLWSTAPLLVEALDIMKIWGFKYRTCAVWDKNKMGMGYWFRIQHELILIGVKGKISPPKQENRVRSVFREKANGHSKKPQNLYGIIENMFPGRRYLELFARTKYNENWTVWGNEV